MKRVDESVWKQKVFLKKDSDLIKKEMISYDLNLTLKTFIKDIDEYIDTNKEKYKF